jgi:hypothetical protein
MSTNLTTEEIADKIRSSALLVSLQLGSYNPVKTDKTESRKVSSSHGINDPKLMKVQKHTLPTAGVLDDIGKLDTKIRAAVDKYTAPFARGIGLLPAIKFFDLRKEVNALFDERATMVKRLADEYSIYLDGAKRSLNGAFKDDDYPPVTDVVSRFYAKLDSFAIANPKDARLGVLGEIAEQIQAAQADTLNDKLSTVVPYLRELLLKALCHQSAILQNPDAKLYETTFTNVLEAAEQAEHLNMLGDEQIINAVFAIRDRLDRTKDQVKDDDHMRKMMCPKAQARPKPRSPWPLPRRFPNLLPRSSCPIWPRRMSRLMSRFPPQKLRRLNRKSPQKWRRPKPRRPSTLMPCWPNSAGRYHTPHQQHNLENQTSCKRSKSQHPN